jgi:hypothetical protein
LDGSTVVVIEKSEICISGNATFRRQPPHKIENPRGYRLGKVSGKTFATGGLNQVLGCTNLTLDPTGSFSY